MAKKLSVSVKASCALLLLMLLFPVIGKAQSGDVAVEELIKMGFENVSCTDTDEERVYVVQNTAYRLQGVGMAKAVDVIRSLGMPEDRNCRIVVLDNNVPQYSLFYQRGVNEQIGDNTNVGRAGWESSYELGDSWKIARKTKKKNRSLNKVDLVVYPNLSYTNFVINVPYRFLITLDPTIEVSLWNGMKFVGQVIIPIKNEFASPYGEIRQGYVALSQDLRWKNLFLTATVGTFSNFRWGGDLQAKYVFKDSRFTLNGEIGLTGLSRFENWRWIKGDLKRLTWSFGGSFTWPKYNVRFDLRARQYLLHERGVQFQMVRNFRHATIGFWASKIQHAGNHGLDGGFLFTVNLPPYKYKRTGYVPRILPSFNTGLVYEAGNERTYGKSFTPRVDRNFGTESSFNPIFIKSELLNY